MTALLRFHLLQVLRSKLLILWVLFSFFVQYSVVKILLAATLQIQGMATNLGLPEIAMALLYAQFAAAGVLATVYGIWMLPYLHEDARAPLTYALPVDKIVFPAVYGLSFLFLMAIQFIGLLVCVAWQFGVSGLSGESFPWKAIGSGMLFTVLALETMVFWLAVVTLVFGRIGAFIGGSAVILVLQVSGMLFRTEFGRDSLWRKIYVFLPPLGEIFFDFRDVLGQTQTVQHLVLWVIWLFIFVGIFRYRLGRA